MLFNRGSSVKNLVVVPVSVASKRLPRKPLLVAKGKPLFVHTFQNALRSKLADMAVVSTSDGEIIEACNEYKVPVYKNRRKHKNGTSRCHEAAEFIGAKYVVNLQVDEPMIKAGTIDECFRELEKNDLVTAVYKPENSKEVRDPNNVKVIVNKNGDAVYFSRSVVPYNSKQYWLHAGIYGYKAAMLKKYVALKESQLEIAESLEQLRFIANGYTFRVFTVPHVVGINSRRDWNRFKLAGEIRRKREN